MKENKQYLVDFASQKSLVDLFEQARQIFYIEDSIWIDYLKIDSDGEIYGVIEEYGESDISYDITHEDFLVSLEEHERIKQEKEEAHRKAMEENIKKREEAAIAQELKDLERLMKKYPEKVKNTI
jgi:hypothetical protein